MTKMTELPAHPIDVESVVGRYVAVWSEADQTLAKALQKEIGAKVDGLKTKVKALEPPKESMGGGSDDVGDISWNVPMVYLRYPANIPNLPGQRIEWSFGIGELGDVDGPLGSDQRLDVLVDVPDVHVHPGKHASVL